MSVQRSDFRNIQSKKYERGDFKKSKLIKCKAIPNMKNNNSAVCTSNQSKWQITLTSRNCTIKKYLEGWQVYPNNENDAEKDLRLTLTIPKVSSRCAKTTRQAKMVDAEICCNREDLQELFEVNDEEESGNINLTEYLKLMTNDKIRINFLLTVLTRAINEHKCYVIYGTFPILRKPLADRGWVEKKAVRRMISLTPDVFEDGLDQIEKLLQTPPDLIWITNKNLYIRTDDDKTIVNKFVGSYFTSKVDLCNNLGNSYWFYEDGVSDIQFPRCYIMHQPGQIEEFMQEYYVTACFGILKWFLLLADLVGPKNAWSPNGTIPITAISFALERCVEYISIQTHEDIDRDDYEDVSSSTWRQHLNWFHKLINKCVLLQESDKVDINELVVLVRTILKRMIKYRPQNRIDGMRNIWILKPGNDSLGRGIVLKNSLSDILVKINQAAKERTVYVVQKYIERPFLVHNTKIDIRQWFLITRTQPLVVWMYKDILVRFASKYFTLNDFHKSIHLCNTTVQLKYRNLPRCNSDLPKELHWNLKDFKDYLQSHGQESAWEKVIRPQIKQNLIGALLASQDNMVNRKRSFQLYGADFVIADDFSVWLLEINMNPRLYPPSSEVTAKLYPEVIEDAMKVVLDRRTNKGTSHSRFECIYRQRSPFHGVNLLGQATGLGIRGKGLFATPKSPQKSLMYYDYMK